LILLQRQLEVKLAVPWQVTEELYGILEKKVFKKNQIVEGKIHQNSFFQLPANF
jgi:hypothetical protein